MLIKHLPLSLYSTNQLQSIGHSVEMFIFAEAPLFLKGEPYAPTLRKDKKHFQAILSNMVSFKRDIMAFFKKQYENRYNLVRKDVIAAAEGDEESDDDYFYMNQWNQEDTDLASIIEQQTQTSYNLGAGRISNNGMTDHTATSEDAQKYLLDNAVAMAAFINATTRRRLAVQIKAAVKLDATRAEFDQRMADVFNSAYRGRFIAQHEALKTYMQGKANAASDAGLTVKTWVGPQAIDEICGSVDGKTIPIEDTFSNGFDEPPAHYGCRCDIEYS